MFKKDIFLSDRDARSRNVKRLQQVLESADVKASSPLDAACRLKYVLEYIMLKQDVSHLYTKETIALVMPKPETLN
jgi:hypothetical protein